MDITWYGLSCFRLRERGIVAICDPFSKEATGISPPKLRADIVTISHDSPAHNHSKGISGAPKILQRPGDYEVKHVLVTGLPTSPNGTRNVAFFLDFAGFTVGHLGDLSKSPAQRQVEELGDIDILLAPVSGARTLDVSRIAEVISLLDPRIVVPMHYRHDSLRTAPGNAGVSPASSALADSLEPVDRFLKELGISDPEVVDTLKLTKHSLPEETQVVLLRPTQAAR